MVLDRWSDGMCHTAATVFSHTDGAVGFAPLPPGYRRQDDLARVRQVWHHVGCTYLPGDNVF